MREVLCEIATRLSSAPDRAAELTLKRAEISDRLHQALDSLKAREAEVAGAVAAERNGDGKPKFPNEASRNAETNRRLQADASYQQAKAEADRLRAELRQLDAEIERVGRRHRSDANLAYLAANLLAAGMRGEFEAVLKAYGGVQAEAEAKAEAQDRPEAEVKKPEAERDVETGTFTVTEARLTSKGVLRAYCEGPDGKVAVYAKNGVAKVLSGAVGGKVSVKFKRLDKGLFALEARPVA
ncbi:hypothetical protein EDD75_2237 [Thermodesulfitimonas autotrophica]|uniref:Uncharacterized protein n=1 Tax=Thermodesulfitimonas autotrophica TaxID=1894989 RepID=A0A3N5AAZ2_9THEO|nr:hypothetical protein [Thermodesulfitimonas autotrophica]RPF42016.1 hypothetical protein EDD75_2237 [Thermodesulfitimonas autotrophica]